MEETFVDSPIFPDKYLIGNAGTVVTKATGFSRKWSMDTRGYHYVILHSKGTRQNVTIHKLVALAFVENTKPDVYNQVNHRDGVKINNVSSNLEWTDGKGNTKHAYDTGLKVSIKGEQHTMSKHTEKQVHNVCQLLVQGVPYKKICEITGLRHHIVRTIRAGKSWKHISSLYKFKDQRIRIAVK